MFLWPEHSTETEVGVETWELASIDVTEFAENIDFIGVERSFGVDRRHTSGPENKHKLKITNSLGWVLLPTLISIRQFT